MLKTFVATGFTCLSIGSIIGYFISELTRQPQNLQAQNTPAAVATASPKPLTRDELERRYIACIGRDVKLTRFSDADLNNDLYECETQRKANSNR
jgi:hypothetical protein